MIEGQRVLHRSLTEILFEAPIHQIGPLGPWYIVLESAAWLPAAQQQWPGLTDPADFLSRVLTTTTPRLGQLLLESLRDPLSPISGPLAQYSYWLPEAAEWLATRQARLEDWLALRQQVQSFVSEPLPADFPPFGGGAAGLLSYDWCRALERIAPPARDDFQVPTLAMGIYDHAVVVAHDTGRLFLIATGFPQQDLTTRAAAATARLRSLAKPWAKGAAQGPSTWPSQRRWSAHLPFGDYTSLECASAELPAALGAELRSGTPPNDYLDSLRQALAYLRAGDIFQVNLAQQLLAPLRYTPAEFYLRARRHNQAPFAGYFDLGNHQLVSMSPERLVCVRGRQVQTRPIKGTRRLSGDPSNDAQLGQELRTSRKECAENVMIVDLLRNDLSRVCSPTSLRVERLCGLESYRHVQHMVSVVTGELAAQQTAWDLLPAVFPGGSISGAPKVRAMQIINELEPVARGAYCGSLGYIGFPDSSGQASADWNILIRTATLCGDWAQIPVGGGIVLDSDPAAEYRETLDKARGLLLAAAPAIMGEG